MPPDEPSGPDLDGVVADAEAAGLECVVIGGFSVIYHGYVRATKDSDLLVPDGPDADGRCCRHGIIDIMHGGLPPLDYATVAARADVTEWAGHSVRIAALPSVVGFKRLAGRPQDRLDLSELEAIYGSLPFEPIPALDT